MTEYTLNPCQDNRAVNYGLELEVLHPQECDTPGYYIYPENTIIAINIDGSVINCLNKRPYKITYRSDRGNRMRPYVLYQVPGGNSTSILVYRILAHTFIGRPKHLVQYPHSMLEVNHIDGNAENNRLENLEWVTKQENLKHARDINAHRTMQPVIMRDMNTLETFYFDSITDCYDEMKINRSTLQRVLQQPEWWNYCYRTDTTAYQFQYADKAQDWRKPDEDKVRYFGEGLQTHSRRIYVRNIRTGVISEYPSINHVAREFTVPYSTLTLYLNNRMTHHVHLVLRTRSGDIERYEARYAGDKTAWMHTPDQYGVPLGTATSVTNEAIVVRCLETGEDLHYDAYAAFMNGIGGRFEYRSYDEHLKKPQYQAAYSLLDGKRYVVRRKDDDWIDYPGALYYDIVKEARVHGRFILAADVNTRTLIRYANADDAARDLMTYPSTIRAILKNAVPEQYILKRGEMETVIWPFSRGIAWQRVSQPIYIATTSNYTQSEVLMKNVDTKEIRISGSVRAIAQQCPHIAESSIRKHLYSAVPGSQYVTDLQGHRWYIKMHDNGPWVEEVEADALEIGKTVESKRVRVLARHIRTGEIRVFEHPHAVTKELGIPGNVLTTRVKNDTVNGLVYRGWQLKIDDGRPWLDLEVDESSEGDYMEVVAWVVLNPPANERTVEFTVGSVEEKYGAIAWIIPKQVGLIGDRIVCRVETAIERQSYTTMMPILYTTPVGDINWCFSTKALARAISMSASTIKYTVAKKGVSFYSSYTLYNLWTLSQTHQLGVIPAYLFNRTDN